MKESPIIVRGARLGSEPGDLVDSSGRHIMLRRTSPTIIERRRREDGNYALPGDLVINVATGHIHGLFMDRSWLSYMANTPQYAEAKAFVIQARPALGNRINWRS